VGLAKLSWEHSTKDWEWVLGVNMWSIIHANRYFIPRMLQQSESSRILNTASAAGLLSTPGELIHFANAVTIDIMMIHKICLSLGLKDKNITVVTDIKRASTL
jgi:NAD(P)-dependent dehydrogenase (short-subunit alcohol dehydrogenase family)